MKEILFADENVWVKKCEAQNIYRNSIHKTFTVSLIFIYELLAQVL